MLSNYVTVKQPLLGIIPSITHCVQIIFNEHREPILSIVVFMEGNIYDRAIENYIVIDVTLECTNYAYKQPFKLLIL